MITTELKSDPLLTIEVGFDENTESSDRLSNFKEDCDALGDWERELDDIKGKVGEEMILDGLVEMVLFRMGWTT